MFTVVSEADVRLMALFTRRLQQACTTSPFLRTMFMHPETAPYTLSTLRRMGDCADYVPLPPTEEMLRQLGNPCNANTIFKQCDIVAIPSEKWIAHAQWDVISRFQPLTQELTQELVDAHAIVWDEVARNKRVPVNIFLENFKNINFEIVSRTIDIWKRSVDELAAIEHLLHWDVVSASNDCFPHAFVRAFADVLDWAVLSTSILEPATLTEHAEYIDWTAYVQTHAHIDIETLRHLCEHDDTVRSKKWWRLATKHLVFTDEMLDEFANMVDWSAIAKSKKYAADTKRRFASRMWWKDFSTK